MSFSTFSAEMVCASFPQMNVWPTRPEAGLDYANMPSLKGSGLEKYFQAYRPATPLPPPSELAIIIEGLTAITPLMIFRGLLMYRGMKVLEEAIRNEPIVPTPSWDEITTILRESTWEHEEKAP